MIGPFYPVNLPAGNDSSATYNSSSHHTILDSAVNNTLSHTSAFWAIVPIAINTMCQPSGMILGYSSTWNFVIRCSPVVCALSPVESLVRVCAYGTKNKSPREGLLHWKKRRFGDSDNDKDGSFESLRKNVIFRILLFVFGALPAGIKIFETTGIEWAQVCCISYLGAFAMDEVLTFLAGRHTESSKAGEVPPCEVTTGNATRDATRDHLAYRLLVSTVLWSSGILTHCLPLYFAFAFQSRVFDVEVGMVLWLSITFQALCLGCDHIVRLDTEGDSRASIWTLSLAWISPLGTLGLWIGQICIDRRTDSIGTSLFVAWTITIAVFGLFYIRDCWTATAGDGETDGKRSMFTTLLGWHYVLSHLVLLIFTLAIVYDPTATSRPTWTNWLG